MSIEINENCIVVIKRRILPEWYNILSDKEMVGFEIVILLFFQNSTWNSAKIIQKGDT